MKYQFMPVFWGDFLANTMDLTAQEVGAYLLLIAHAWEHDGRVPCKGAQRIARISNYRWAKVRAELEQFFNTSKDPNNWIHERVLSERTKAAEISNKRKEAAMQKHSKRSANGHANRPHTTTTTTNTKLKPSLDKVAARAELYHPPTDAEQAAYRAPPATKSTNVLEPIPERPVPNSGMRRPNDPTG